MAAPANAHRMKAGATEVAVNDRTGELEIIHRVYAHDLIEALGDLNVDEAEFMASETGLQQIENLVRSEFRVAEGDGLAPLVREVEAVELEGGGRHLGASLDDGGSAAGGVVGERLARDLPDLLEQGHRVGQVLGAGLDDVGPG